MPKRILGVSARLLECAKEEFLSKGFQSASIREIAKKAETSPRAVYTRFPNKDGLFDAIVEPAIQGLIELYQNFGNEFWAEHQNDTEVAEFSSDPNEIYLQMIDYIYDHIDEFILILKCSDGTHYANLIEQLTQLNIAHLEKFESETMQVENFDIMMKVLHLLTHSFYSALFQPLLHDMSREDARFYVRKLCNFFACGTTGLLQ